jgi:hypothetical protein
MESSILLSPPEVTCSLFRCLEGQATEIPPSSVKSPMSLRFASLTQGSVEMMIEVSFWIASLVSSVR